MPSWVDSYESSDDKILNFAGEYKNLVAKVNKILTQQVEKNRQQTYKNIMSKDSEGFQKQLDQKQYVIEDMNAIQKVQGELVRNLRTEPHELKKHRDMNGLKKEMYVLKTELRDHKKDKKQFMKDKIEVMHERDGLQIEKKMEIALAELTIIGEIHKGKLKKIKGICGEDSIIELTG
ncbi:hypothetical protein ZWY2020_031821 [Hordeum vulgare]|nr:hypothetical protein ZWY2020_031821 [Hordeum vulgare]